MSATDALFPLVRDEIEFDSLLGQATQTLKTYAGNCWTDTAEHDPGITLMEAFGYGVADLAYRQTRPLTDLLTPPPEQQVEGEGLFPAEFGPHQALTCGPITEADYRRALLDLHSSGTDDGYFFFRNVRLVREPEAERYRYWYDPQFREYRFTEPQDSGGESPVCISLLGNYHLYLMPSRETESAPLAAMAALDAFLLDNRNLGESVSRVIWLQPEDLHLDMVIDLADDIGTNSNVAAILADIYRVCEAYVAPPVTRCSTAQLQEMGRGSEDIHHGPWLQYGWIPQLPPQMDGTVPTTMNLSGLVGALLDVDGVKGIRHLGAEPDSASRLQWVASKPGVYPRLWGADPLTVLAAGGRVKLLASGDVPLTASVQAIKAELDLDKAALICNLPQVLPYGRWRDPGRYYPATGIVPPCYSLRVPAVTPGQTRLHQFLLTFEQLLANGCRQQALLPALLSFKRQGDVVWGRQWPFADGTVSDLVHTAYRPALESYLEQSCHDRKQELAIVGFLLGYFNSQLAPNIFTQPADTFLASQQGFLSRQTELAYHRSNIRHHQVSSLQRRIAARLGLGGVAIFDDDAPQAQLPFYLVEHRALLPVRPAAQYDALQIPIKVTEEVIDDRRCLTLFNDDVSGLSVGNLVDILLHPGLDELRIRGQMVVRVDAEQGSFSVDIDASQHLGRRLNDILGLSPEELGWQNSNVWFEDMNYRLAYAPDQSGLASDEKRLTCTPFPVMVTNGDVLVLEYQITPNALARDGSDDHAQSLEVVSVDRIANTVVVRSDFPFPSESKANQYHWYFSRSVYASQDRFSFMVSAVFNQRLLLDLSSDPYATESWVRETILEEIPSHTRMLLHWKPEAEFNQFADTYTQWQGSGGRLGDKSCDLLYMLALGHVPAELPGIGSRYIASAEQKEEVIGSEGDQWNSDVITRDQLFFVPDIDNFDLVGTVQAPETNPLTSVQWYSDTAPGTTLGIGDVVTLLGRADFRRTGGTLKNRALLHGLPVGLEAIVVSPELQWDATNKFWHHDSPPGEFTYLVKVRVGPGAPGVWAPQFRVDGEGSSGWRQISPPYTITQIPAVKPTLVSVKDPRGAEVEGGTRTVETAFTLTGTASPYQTVQIEDGSGEGAAKLGTVTAGNTGNWVFTTGARPVGARRIYARSLNHDTPVFSNVRQFTIVA
ncbi:hypothetical protein WM04_13480 [Burkholderia ubonensis]|uniref:hypothetical protein n=1 Tax=Burkholderia ubonensis TaxID=101571 RepID=UPI0007547DA5|nr:hypothetical protein [Burkholderia ubonensis]KWI32621.1 hypothetical protein WM04_13480 [Burkholderia ubonensis]OJB13511.1 hypothetical protein BGV53_25375 [Burkholderia ubonensis]